MPTSITESTKFLIFRFQIIPVDPDPDNFQSDLFEEKSLEELLEKKTDIFAGIIAQLPQATEKNKIRAIDMKKIDDYKYLFLLEAQRSKKVEKERKETAIPHFPTIWVAIDVSPSTQIIAIEQRQTFSQSSEMPINTIKREVSKALEKRYLKIKIYPVSQPNSFWEYVDQHQDVISSVEFELSAPNMPRLSAKIGEELKDLGRSSNSETTRFSMRSPRGETLKLNKKNRRLRGLVETVEQGGGQTSFTHKGSPKKLYHQNEQAVVIAPPSTDELPGINSRESIWTKITKLFRLS